MGRRTWIDSEIWYDIRKLSAEEQSLYLHLLINDNGNIAGYYRLNLQHLASDMKMDEEPLTKMLNMQTKYWMYDEETEQVLIPKYTKYNIVKGMPQEKKLNAVLSDLTPCKLDKEFIAAWTAINGIGSEMLLDRKFRDRAGYI